ncbi:hypothetical protein [Pseudomonas moraviensis]|uniref:hypothetical protein n=1 Tax=Pseudomonas moraviensis TaxID=321662 RepID=UPI00105A133E|nr:hypothetical protein [Pseudomonas moraviensis]TDK52597.1 hypothetical protein E1508_22885 [Pseudomonas moraviensis]
MDNHSNGDDNPLGEESAEGTGESLETGGAKEPGTQSVLRSLAYPKTGEVGNIYKRFITTLTGPAEILKVHYKDGNSNNYIEEQWAVGEGTITLPADIRRKAGKTAIHYVTYKNGSWGNWYDSGWFTMFEPPVISFPAPEAVISAEVITITGRLIWGAMSLQVFKVVGEGAEIAISARVTGIHAGPFSINLNQSTQGHYRVFVRQTTNSGPGDLDSDIVAFSVIDRVQITSVREGSTSVEGATIHGSGALPDAKVEVYGLDLGDLVLHATVNSDGTWSTSAHRFEPGKTTFIAIQVLRNVSSKTSFIYEFTFSGPPIITGPAPLQEPAFSLDGERGRAGAVLKVYEDLAAGPVYGTATVPPGHQPWTVAVKGIRPGPISLVVEDSILGRGAPRAFRIRPPKPELPVIGFPDETTVTFSGKGHYDPDFPTRIQFTVKTGEGNAPAVAEVQNDGTWTTTATGWELGNRTLVAIQQIADNPSGWIDSLPFEFVVEKKLSPVSNVKHTDDYQPIFSGAGVTNATVSIWLTQSEFAAPDVVVKNGSWSTRASNQWGPTNNRKISIQQTLNGFESWLDYYVSIAPREPGLDVPPEDGLRPIFSGTCWPDAVVNLTFSDSGSSFAAQVIGDEWSFQRPTAFTDGVPYTIEATQTVVGLTSKPGSLTFTVYRERLKPAIKTPLPGQETDSDLTVTGDFGMAGASMQLWDAQEGKRLGDPVLLGQDGPWSVSLTGLAIKTWFITAQQTLNDRASPDSEVREFEVVVMPPEFVHPRPGGDVTRRAILSGTGRSEGLVTVWRRGLDEPLLRDVQIGVDGAWEASVELEIGDKILWATQTFEGKTSKPSLDVPCRVVPAEVKPESPIPEEVLGGSMTVSGFAVPGDLITLKRGSDVLGTAPVLADGTWSIPARLELPDGNVSFSIVASKGEFHSAPSKWESQVSLFLPQFTHPVSGLWVSPTVTFAGSGKPGMGTLMSWYSPDAVLGGPVTVTETGWTVTPTEPLPNGAQWCRFGQTSSTGMPISDVAGSERFDVRDESPGNS